MGEQNDSIGATVRKMMTDAKVVAAYLITARRLIRRQSPRL